MTDFRPLAPDFAVAPQLVRDDFAVAANQGYRLVINNRPDGEAPGQLSDTEAREAAELAGLAYLHIPIRGQPSVEQAKAVAAAVVAHGPTLAYCRSGTRSTLAWAIGMATDKRSTPEAIERAAADAGYDVSSLRMILRELYRL